MDEIENQKPRDTEEFDTDKNYGDSAEDYDDVATPREETHFKWYNPLTWFGGKEDFDGQRAQDDRNYGDGGEFYINNKDSGKDRGKIYKIEGEGEDEKYIPVKVEKSNMVEYVPVDDPYNSNRIAKFNPEDEDKNGYIVEGQGEGNVKYVRADEYKENGGAWDKIKEDLSNSWIGRLFGNKKNDDTENIFKLDEVESDDRSDSGGSGEDNNGNNSQQTSVLQSAGNVGNVNNPVDESPTVSLDANSEYKKVVKFYADGRKTVTYKECGFLNVFNSDCKTGREQAQEDPKVRLMFGEDAREQQGAGIVKSKSPPIMSDVYTEPVFDKNQDYKRIETEINGKKIIAYEKCGGVESFFSWFTGCKSGDHYVYGNSSVKIQSKYDPNKKTVVYIHGFGDETEAPNLPELKDKNVVVVRVNYQNPLKDNTQFAIAELKKLKEQGVNFDVVEAHSAGNRLTLEMLKELADDDDDLLNGVKIVGYNAKITDDKAEGHSTGLPGWAVRLFSDYGDTTAMMDPENPQNRWLSDPEEVETVKKKALGHNTDIAYYIVTNDPHIPQEGDAKKVFQNVIDTFPSEVIKIETEPGVGDAHTVLLNGLDNKGNGRLMGYTKDGYNIIYKKDSEDGVYKPVQYAPGASSYKNNNGAGNTANNNEGQGYDSGEEGSVWYRPTTWFNNWGGFFRENNRDNYVENNQTDGGLPKYLLNNSAGNDNNTVDGGSNEYNKGNNSQQTTDDGDVNSGMISDLANDFSILPAEINIDVLQSAGNVGAVNNPVNESPEKNSYGLDKFLHELLPVSGRINQRVMDYVLEHPGEIDQNKILQIAGDELIHYEVNKLGTSIFGDKDGKVNWFGRDVIKSTEDLASAVVHGDPNAAWVAGVDFLLSTALDSAKQSGDLVGKDGIISDDVYRDIRDGGKEALLTGVKTYLDTGDMDTALKITGAKLGDYYINKVVTPYLEDQFTDLADNFTDNSDLSSGIGAGVGTAFGVGGGNALLQWAATGKVDVEQVAVASFEPAVEAGLNAYYGIDILQNQVDTAMAAVEAGQEGAEVALGAAQNELQAASQAVKDLLPYVKVAVMVYKVTKIFDDGKITIQEVKSMVDSVVVGELMTMGPYGWAAAAVYLVVSSFCCKKKVPKDYEIADAKTSAQEAINPSFMIKGLPGEELSKVIMVARSGDVDKAKSMMNDVLRKSALGKIVDMTGLSPLFDSALALMNNRITRLRNDFKPGELEGYTGDNIHTGDTALDEATNKYMHLKNKLKDCYLRKDKDCVNDVSMEIRKVRNGLIALATNKFNDEIAELNKEIHDLENQLAQAKSAKERAELQARLSRARNRRDTLRQARDQYIEIAHSCPPKTMWHVVDHYCIEISKNKAHCEKGGGTWHQANPLTCDGSYCECKCEKSPGGHWMGNHCEYGFNEKQQEQLRLRDAADACSHKIGRWRWDGHNCVEVSSKPPKRPKPSVNQATRFGGDDDSEGE